MRKWIFAAALSVLVLVYFSGFLLPAERTVSTDVIIDASPQTIFAFIGDLRQWPRWQPWFEQDPQSTAQISSPAYGNNAALLLSSTLLPKREVIFAEWQLNQFVAYRLKIEDQKPAIGRIEIASAMNGTKVTWSIRSAPENNPARRYLAWARGHFTAKDFKKGLTQLKRVCENNPAPPLPPSWDSN